jgi:hypothetical protein
MRRRRFSTIRSRFALVSSLLAASCSAQATGGPDASSQAASGTSEAAASDAASEHNPALDSGSPLIFIKNVLSPYVVRAGQTCMFTADPTQLALPSGTLDVALKSHYDAELLVGVQLPAEDGSSQGGSFNVQGVSVVIDDAHGNVLASYERLVAATVPAGSPAAPGFSPVGPLTILDQHTVASLDLDGSVQAVEPINLRVAATNVQVYLQVFGTTSEGVSLASMPFVFKIEVCRGCLVIFVPDDIDPSCPSPNCLGSGEPGWDSAPVSCEIGQEITVDCHICSALGVPECSPNMCLGVSD